MKVISTFSGCGGSSLGYQQAGGKVLLAVEYDDHAAQMYAKNFPKTKLYHGDIAQLTGEETCQLTGLKPTELDILDGSPPCQGFSTAGRRIFHDTRNQLFREYVRLLRYLQPKTFVMENVAGMVKGKMKLIFAECLKELRASGYRVRARLFNTSSFGVPQSRRRLIFMGVRDDLNIEPSFPKPCGPIVSIMEAIEGADTSGVPQLSQRYADIYEQVPYGGNASDVWKTKSHFSDCIKPHPRKPCCTLPKMQTGTGFATICHPFEPRALSIGEAKRIQTFPDDFILTGSYANQWARIGNSVPPLFMKQIATHIRQAIIAV
ncbi:MAG: DNA cytosine methyltransferase [Planctomycetaceae bacterium]